MGSGLEKSVEKSGGGAERIRLPAQHIPSNHFLLLDSIWFLWVFKISFIWIRFQSDGSRGKHTYRSLSWLALGKQCLLLDVKSWQEPVRSNMKRKGQDEDHVEGWWYEGTCHSWGLKTSFFSELNYREMNIKYSTTEPPGKPNYIFKNIKFLKIHYMLFNKCENWESAPQSVWINSVNNSAINLFQE